MRFSRPLLRLLALSACLLHRPAGAAINEAFLPPIREAMNAAIAARSIPGGVLWMENGGKPFCEAFGSRMVDPVVAPMTADVIFDAASLTKVLATAPSVLLCVQDGKLKLETPVCQIIPEFTGGGKEAVTVRHLLTHTSGTRSGIPRERPYRDYAGGVAAAAAELLQNPPGERFRYSDINYILLGDIVRRVSGTPLDVFAAQRLFEPLGMTDTGYRPSRKKLDRMAPTEREAAGLVHGVVHDPTCRRMGGVAGHAGVFTTAADVALYCRMLLNGGRTAGGRRIFTAPVLKLLTHPVALPGGVQRSMGFDVQSYYSDLKGELFGPQSFGHTGWTGTAFWIDPQSRAFVVLLTNRNHPAETGTVRELRTLIGTLAAQAMGGKKRTAWNSRAGGTRRVCRVRNGVDVVADGDSAVLKGRRVGLITNHTGRTRDGKSTMEVLAERSGATLVCLFSPEHGIRGREDREGIGDSVDQATGLPVYSLYGKTRRPLRAQCAGLDALVFDIQDAGCRFYTYIATMLECLIAADEYGIGFVVLDRVNPVNGITVDGPLPEGALSFVACHRIPLRHGMTAGELALLFARERKLKRQPEVVPVTGWDRRTLFSATGLPWINPSPNMRSLEAAVVYPGVALLEFCNVSVGRGTDTPFLVAGAPWVDAARLAAALEAEKLPGLAVRAVEFTPADSTFQGEVCHGVRLTVQDPGRVAAVRTGIALATALQRLHGGQFRLDPVNRLLVHPAALESIRGGRPVEETMALWASGSAAFLQRRAAVLLYPES